MEHNKNTEREYMQHMHMRLCLPSVESGEEGSSSSCLPKQSLIAVSWEHCPPCLFKYIISCHSKQYPPHPFHNFLSLTS